MKKIDKSLITIVSSFYLLPSSKHKDIQYVIWMINFFKIKTKKIIFTDKFTYDKLFNKIKDKSLKFIIYNINNFKVTKLLSNFQWKYQHSLDPEWKIHNTNLYKIWNLWINSFRCRSIFIWCKYVRMGIN